MSNVVRDVLFKGFISLSIFIFSLASFAINGRTTYQARIVKPDGYPLQASSVNFRFTVLDQSGSCVIYVEDYAAINMTDTGGLISFPLGSGARTFPTSGTSQTFQNTFDNSITSFACQTMGIYNPNPTDTRKIVMQFNDGNGWQTLPAMSINAVPYAMFATRADNSRALNGKTDTAFVEYSALNGLGCAADQAIKYNGVSFSCITVGTSSTPVTSSSVIAALGYTPAQGASFTSLDSTVNSVSGAVYSVSSTVNGLTNSVTSLSNTVAASFAAITSSQWSTSGTNIFYNSGNVGIGTATPSALLDVGDYGSSAFASFSSVANFASDADSQSGIEMKNKNVGTSADFRLAIFDTGGNYISITQPSVSNTGTIFGLPRSQTSMIITSNASGVTARDLAIGTYKQNHLILGTSSYERMRITSSGAVGIGTSAPTTKLDVAGGIRISMESATCAVSFAGTLRYNSGNVEYCNGSAWLPFGVAGAGITSINGSTSGSQTFATGITGTVFNISSANGVHTFNIPLAASGSVTAGLLSNADYLTFTNKVSATSASVISALGYTPLNSSVSGTYLVKANDLSDLASATVARANLGLGALATLNYIDLSSTAASGTLSAASLPAVGSGVTSGTQYTKVTVDGKGRVISGSQVTLNDILHVYTGNGGLFVGSGTSRPLVEDSNTAESTAFGVNSMAANQSGGQNTAFGYATLEASVTSYENAAFGWYALAANTTGQFNTAIGAEAMWANTTGVENTAVGGAALNSNTTGYYNSAVGMVALGANTSGTNNVGVGLAAGRANKTGHRNVYLGAWAGDGPSNNSDVSSTVIIGYNAASNISTGANNNIVIGANAAGNLTTGPNNIVIGNNVNTVAATSSGTLNIGNLIFGNGLDGTGSTVSTGNIGIGVSNPTAKFHLAAGTAANAPLKFTSGTLLASPQSGTMEYDGSEFYLTDGSGVRRFIATGSLDGTYDYVNQLTSTGNISLTPVGSVIVSSTTASTSSNTGALVVKGGVGIAGDLNVAGVVSSSSQIKATGYRANQGIPNANDSSTNGYAFGADGDTGLFSPGSGGANGIVSIFTNNVEMMRVTQTAVGVGTITPNSQLDVAGNAIISNGAAWSTGGIGAITSKLLLGYDTASNVGYIGAETTGTGFREMRYRGNSHSFWVGSGVVSQVMTLNSSGDLGIGTTTPGYKLDIAGDLNVTSGSVYRLNGAIIAQAQTALNNYYLGGAGNLVGTGLMNSAVGYQTLDSVTTGGYNSAFGALALTNNTTGSYNTAVGRTSLYANSSGGSNSAMGFETLYLNTTGLQNSAFGFQALYNNSNGGQNSAVGTSALHGNTTGSLNSALGYNAGKYIADGVTSNATSSNSLYLGAGTKALANGDTNEVVIGYNAVGLGSNTVVLGNDSIATTALKGSVGVGTTAPGANLHVFAPDNNVASIAATGSAQGSGMLYVGQSTAYGAGMLYNGDDSPSMLGNADDVVFFRRDNGVDYEVFKYRYNSDNVAFNGNVGIGTATPQGSLHIVTAVSQTNSPSEGIFLGKSLGNDYQIQLTQTGGTPHIDFSRGGNADYDARISVPADNSLRLGTTSSSALLNLSGLNVGIGVTNPQQKLVVQGGNAALNSIGNASPQYEWRASDNSLRAYISHATETAGASTDENRFYQAYGYKTFYTQGAERVRIDSTGNVGIGTTTPASKLEVRGGNTFMEGKAYVYSNSGWGSVTPSISLAIGDNDTGLNWVSDGVLQVYGNNAVRMHFALDGNNGIGTTTPSYKLDVNGTIRGFGITDSSDARLKKNIVPLDFSLEKILQIEGVSYNWIDKERSPKKQIGFIAQQLEEIYPELVETDKQGMKSVNYSHLVAPLVEAVKTLYHKITGVEREIASLKAENAELKTKVKEFDELKAYICKKDPEAPNCKN